MTDRESVSKNFALRKLQVASISSASDKKRFVRSSALRVTVIYFIVGCLWIFLSDKLAVFLFSEVSGLYIFSLLKGFFYVTATSVLLYLLICPMLKKLLDAYNDVKNSSDELRKSNELYRSLYAEIAENRMFLKTLINSIPDIFFYKNSEGVYLSCNKAFEKYAGKPESEIVGKNDCDLFGAETADSYRRMDLEIMKSGRTMASERVLTYPDGRQVYLETLKTPCYDVAGKVSGIIGIGRDITAHKKREDDIEFLSYHDILTGLYNRSFFQEECRRLDTSRHLPLSVIMGDVNGLKLINDSLGHAEGDKMLKAIADILTACCRKCDIVARTGGDEFAILLPKTDDNTVQSIVERIVETCSEHSSNRTNNVLYTNIALGCATKVSASESLDKIINTAEDFMYRRKLVEYKSIHSSILSSIKTTMSEKNNATKSHADRITKLSRKLGEELGLPEMVLNEIELVSTLHDIGKISLDENILNKPGPLGDEEWREIRKHPEVGFRIANAILELRHLSEYILCHHERWDGKGYPQGLSGEDIPLISRIVAITDAFDAMTQDRPYRSALSEDEAAAEIKKNAGTQFDPNLAEIFTCRVLNKKH
jgi:diguanylate cyclase (GGDEF)-like protein/PAS domain S-box-containing protein